MRLKAVKHIALAACLTLLAAAALPAATTVEISDLYNTGMSSAWNDPVQTPLPGSDPGVAVDPHWDVTYPDSTTIDTRTISDTSGIFTSNQFNRYQQDLAADPDRQDTNLDESQWIMPNIPGLASSGGIYQFTTTFTTDQALTSISISGYFKGVDILGVSLNGGPMIDQGNPHNAPSEHSPSRPSRPFSITGSGTFTNTLTFFARINGTNLVAVRVQFDNATFTVPEPSTIAMSVLGLVGFGAVRLRRRLSGRAAK